MNSLRVLGTAAAIALILPIAVPSAGFAQERGARGGRAGVSASPSVGGGATVSGGNFNAGARVGGPGPSTAYTGSARVNTGGATVGTQRFATTSGNTYNGGRTWQGGSNWQGGNNWQANNWRGNNWRGDNWRGDRWNNGAFIGGALAGAAIGSAYAYDYPGYYGDYGYYDDGYYGDGYGYDVAVAPAPVGGDGAGYCAQRYRSYDPASGTYLGFDGLRHPCP